MSFINSNLQIIFNFYENPKYHNSNSNILYSNLKKHLKFRP